MKQMTKEEEWLLSEKYSGVQSPEFLADVERLKNGEPLAYVIGFSEFLGAQIDLSFRTLIPRVETEYWVEKEIAKLIELHGADAKLQFLDVFSGSGCIGIALARAFPNSTVDFADIDPNALKQIQKNLELNEVEPSRYGVYESNVFSGIPAGKKYNAIFANPPYIAHKDTDRIEAAVLAHEPHNALFSGESGLELIQTLFQDIDTYMLPDTVVFVEHDDIQYDTLKRMLSSQRDFNFTFNKDQFELWRWAMLSKR